MVRSGHRARAPVSEKEIRDGGSSPKPKIPNFPQRHRRVNLIRDHFAIGPRFVCRKHSIEFPTRELEAFGFVDKKSVHKEVSEVVFLWGVRLVWVVFGE